MIEFLLNARQSIDEMCLFNNNEMITILKAEMEITTRFSCLLGETKFWKSKPIGENDLLKEKYKFSVM